MFHFFLLKLNYMYILKKNSFCFNFWKTFLKMFYVVYFSYGSPFA